MPRVRQRGLVAVRPAAANATACRSRRCWRGSPPCAADRRAPTPAWIDDAIWIEAALQSPGNGGAAGAAPTQGPSTSKSPALEPVAFEHLLAPVVEQAEAKLWAGIGERASANLSASARAGLRHALLKELSGLCAPALYERFGKARKAAAMPAGADKPQRGTGDIAVRPFRRRHEDGRLSPPVRGQAGAAALDRDRSPGNGSTPSREFVLRLDADLATIRHDILRSR